MDKLFPHTGSRRKVFALCLPFLLSAAILTACAKEEAPPSPDLLTQHTGNFDTTAHITYRELKATATIKRDTPQACMVSFTAPDSLADMAFVFHQDSVDLSYKDLSFTFDPHTVPGGAVANVAVTAINRAMKGEGLSVDYTEGILTLYGQMDSGGFSLRLDPADGNLLKLSVPEEELEIEFVNFTFLD